MVQLRQFLQIQLSSKVFRERTSSAGSITFYTPRPIIICFKLGSNLHLILQGTLTGVFPNATGNVLVCECRADYSSTGEKISINWVLISSLAMILVAAAVGDNG